MTQADRAAGKMSDAAKDVLAERERQKSVEGWSEQHDDEHGDYSMARAAAAYANHAAAPDYHRKNFVGAPRGWPWGPQWWKPKDRRRDLVRAGALILAEIERLDRAQGEVEVIGDGCRLCGWSDARGQYCTGACNMGSHIVNGQFQSDKYPTTPPGKVPLSVKDPMAQDLLWEYAQRRRAVDAEFSDDLETALKAAGYAPKGRKG